MPFRITRGDDEYEIVFSLKYDSLEQNWYPARTYLAETEEEIDLTPEENEKLMEYYYANEDKLLYHNDESKL